MDDDEFPLYKFCVTARRHFSNSSIVVYRWAHDLREVIDSIHEQYPLHYIRSVDILVNVYNAPKKKAGTFKSTEQVMTENDESLAAEQLAIKNFKVDDYVV